MKPPGNVVITGVSTGIGFAAARGMLRAGYRVWGTVRREADAARLFAEGGGRFRALVMDVTREEEIRAAAARVGAELPPGERLHALVNNAGIAVGGPLAVIPLAEVRRQFDVNVFGPLAMIQAFMPLLERRGVDAEFGGSAELGARAGGRIINIGSVSGKVAFPFFGPYSASKFALEALSDALRREVGVRGVRVVLIEPGSVRTEIWDKAEAEDASHYRDAPEFSALEIMHRLALKTGRAGVEVDRVVDAILKALREPNPRPRYQVVRHRLTDWILPRMLPDRLMDRIIARAMRPKP